MAIDWTGIHNEYDKDLLMMNAEIIMEDRRLMCGILKVLAKYSIHSGTELYGEFMNLYRQLEKDIASRTIEEP